MIEPKIHRISIAALRARTNVVWAAAINTEPGLDFHIVYRFVGESRNLDNSERYVDLGFTHAVIQCTNVHEVMREVTLLWAEKYADRAYLAPGFTEDRIRVGMLATVQDFTPPTRNPGETNGQWARVMASLPRLRPAEVTKLITAEDGFVAGVDVRLEDVASYGRAFGGDAAVAEDLAQEIRSSRSFRKTIHHYSPSSPVNEAAYRPNNPTGMQLALNESAMEPRTITMDGWGHGLLRVVLGRHPSIAD